MRALDLIGQGNTETIACDSVGLTVAEFRACIRKDDALGYVYEEALQRGHDAMADALLDIQAHSVYGTQDAKMAAVVSKNIMWFLARKRPKEYGDHVTITHEITADKIIVEALTRGKDRAIAGAVLEGVEYHPVLNMTDDERERLELEALY